MMNSSFLTSNYMLLRVVQYKANLLDLIKFIFISVCILVSSSSLSSEKIDLNQALELAQKNDPWLHGNRLKQQAVEHKSKASSTLPDPKVSIGLLNLPVDTGDFSEQAMSQFKVGVTQMFPRGDSLNIQAKQLEIESTKFPLLRLDRKAKLTSLVSQLWLDAFLAQKTIELIKNDELLFEQMAEVAKASYANAVGKTRQQDVIRAQLEIIKLQERLLAQQQKFEMAMAGLSEWLMSDHDYSSETDVDYETISELQGVSEDLPIIQLRYPQLLSDRTISANMLAETLTNHPAILAITVRQKSSEQGISLAKQKYKPQWGVNASYAYRDDSPMGDERSDFFSVGVSFDLPLFTNNRQDKQVAAVIAESEAIKTDKILLTKNMISAIKKETQKLKRLLERQTIYQSQLLTQSYEQAESTLTAYTNDDGDFAEVVRARIAELNIKISALNIDVDVLKTVARLNYYFVMQRPNNTSNQTEFVGE